MVWTVLRSGSYCQADWRVVFRGRPRFEMGCAHPQAFRRDAVVASRGMGSVSACGRPGGKALSISISKLCRLEMVQGKGAEGPLRPEPGLQASPEEGGENNAEVEMQFGLRTGLAVVEAQMLLASRKANSIWKRAP